VLEQFPPTLGPKPCPFTTVGSLLSFGTLAGAGVPQLGLLRGRSVCGGTANLVVGPTKRAWLCGWGRAWRRSAVNVGVAGLQRLPGQAGSSLAAGHGCDRLAPAWKGALPTVALPALLPQPVNRVAGFRWAYGVAAGGMAALTAMLGELALPWSLSVREPSTTANGAAMAAVRILRGLQLRIGGKKFLRYC